jgi:hypothetical protein
MNKTPVAKSLHTVTVLVQVARLHETLSSGFSRVEIMAKAMETLGLAGRPDPHGLEEKALRMMDKK